MRRIRFEQVDLLGIVRNGGYPSFLEDGCMASGERYWYEYLEI